MNGKLQEGIFYNSKIFRYNNSFKNYNDAYNNTFAILFFKIRKKSTIDQVFKSLENLWTTYQKLKKGIIKDLPNQRVPHGSLSMTLGYGQSIFKLNNIKKSIPRDFNNSQFCPPKKDGGGNILEGSNLSYSKDIHENVGLDEDIVVQFVANKQLAVYRAIVETRKNLRSDLLKKNALIFSNFFTGFQRDDGRSWLGFHDEVSNLRPGKERRDVITIHKENNALLPSDFWTENGTYMAFLRIEIDLDLWDSINRSKQELIIGREKLYGRPLIGVDTNNNPITLKNFPTAQKVTAYDKRYHDHPDYFKAPQIRSKEVMKKIDINKSFKVLNESHIGRTRHFDKINSKLIFSRRIYRQAFDFIESYHSCKQILKVGLNFLSFQNDPARLLFILTDPNWMGNTSFGGDSQFKAIDKLLHVQACGIFFIPKIEKPFPGSCIFK
jgi:deferrochelatase/peroxidase EfeB